MRQFLQRFVDIRPGEGRAFALTFLYTLLVVASFLLAKPIRSGLFLGEFQAQRLVYVYVAVPVMLSLFVPLYNRLTARVGQQAAAAGTLLFFFSNVLAFWWSMRQGTPAWLVGTFYVWVNCFGIIAPVQGWALATALFDTRQAKRLFPLIASGASFGAIGGGLLARVLVRPVGGTVNLLLVLALLILAAAVVVCLVARLPRGPDEPAGARATEPTSTTLATIFKTRYLALIAAAVFMVAIVSQWTQFQLHLAARERFSANADLLTAFYGSFSLYTGIGALLLQILLTGTVLRRFGLAVAIVVLPGALGLGALGILLVPGFWSVLATNALDQGLRFSLDKSTYELLFLPLSSESRWNVKVTIDTVVNRAADGVGGIALGLATAGFMGLPGAGFGLRGLAALTAVMVGPWIVIALALQRDYVRVIRETLRQHRLDAERAATAMRDRTAADQIIDRLGAGDPQEILYALDLFEAQHTRGTHPALQSLLSHRAPEVRRRAVSMLRERGDTSVNALVQRMLSDDDPETRTEALLYLAYHGDVDPVALIHEMGDVPGFSVRAGIIAFLGRPSRFQNLDTVHIMLEQMAGETGPDAWRVRLEAARLLAMLPDEFEPVLKQLLLDSDPRVAEAAMHAAARLNREDLADEILERVCDPELVSVAATALAEMGDAVVAMLGEKLADPAVSLEIRREIPGILLGIGTPAAQQVLFESLFESDTALRHRVISSLNKLRAKHPAMTIDAQIVETVMVAEIMGHYRSYQLLGTLGETLDEEGPVVKALRESMHQEVERIFRLVGLIVPDQDIYTAYVGIESGNRAVRANALEFLDTILNPSLRGLLLPLVDNTVSVAERVQIANRVVGAPVQTREEAVITLLRSDDPWIRSCGAYAVGTLALRDLEPELDRCLDASDALLRETARQAKLRLAEAAAAATVPPAPAPAPILPGAAEWGHGEAMGVG